MAMAAIGDIIPLKNNIRVHNLVFVKNVIIIIIRWGLAVRYSHVEFNELCTTAICPIQYS